MYNKDLADRILQHLSHAFPAQMHLRQLQAELQGFSNVAPKQWLETVAALYRQNLVSCKALTGHDGWEDAAAICLTEKGRRLTSEDERLERLGDKRFQKDRENLYDQLISKGVPQLKASLGAAGLSRSSVFANQVKDAVFDRFSSLRVTLVNSYIRPIQESEHGLTDIRENRLRKKLDQVWEHQLAEAKSVFASLAVTTGLSCTDIQPQQSDLEVRGRKLKLGLLDEIDIAILKRKPEESPKLSHTSPPDMMEDLSFIRDSKLRAIVERDRIELGRLDAKLATKSVLVLSGGVIEALLLDALVSLGRFTLEEGSRKSLNELIELGISERIISEDRLSHATRRYRDLVHPGREVREGTSFDHNDAAIALGAVSVIVREVRNWQAGVNKGQVATA